MYEFSLGETDCSEWIKGETYTCENSLVIPDSLQKGIYTLNLGLYDSKTEQYILLAVQGRDGDNPWYRVGEIKIR